MLKFILKKFFSTACIIFTTITFIFFLINIFQTDPFSTNPNLDIDTIQNLRKIYGLDQPIYVRYVNLLTGLFRLDFGFSYEHIGIPIKDLIFPSDGNSGIYVSMQYGLIVLGVVVSLGILMGILSVINTGWVEKIINIFTTLGFSIPIIVMGPLLIYFFGSKLNLLPTCEWKFDFQHLFLPVLTLSMNVLGYLAQVEKINLYDVMNSQFIKMAKAKGLSRRYIIFKHALKPAFIPIISYLGSIISIILTGIVIVERLFGFPGIGNLMINAALTRDYPMILALIIIFSIIFVVANVALDIFYLFIDPKIKFD